VDHGRFHDLFEGVDVFELRVGVSLGVFVVDAGNFGEVFVLCAVPIYLLEWCNGEWKEACALLHIFSSSIAKHLCSTRRIRNTSCNPHHLTSGSSGVTSVIPKALKGTRHHLLKAHHHNAICASMGDDVARQM
jgi:hypothetical protein